MSHNGHSTLGRIDFAAQRRIVTVEIPELQGSFRLRQLSVSHLNTVSTDAPDRLSRLLALAIVDDNGEQIYKSEEDIANLKEMSISIFNPLIDAYNDLMGFSQKKVDDTTKKSEASLNTASASA